MCFRGHQGRSVIESSGMEGIRDSVERSALALLQYCERENWAGYDPYDGLNSRLLSFLPFSKNRIFRLSVTQGMKRLPVNLRPFLLVPKGENPKACALFCRALLRLSDCGLLNDDSVVAARLERLIELRSEGYPYHCWGYNFDWQSRSLLVPKFTPNVICTTFGGNALIDGYEKYGRGEFADAAASAGEFLINGLNMSHENGAICFSYTPLDHAQVHNANLLGAAFLGRLGKLTGREQFLDIADRAARFSLSRQRDDGSWLYGEGETQRWIDNFHTGYNLVALWGLADVLKDRAANDAIYRGLDFFVNHFFAADGVPRYYHDRVWPVDIHCVAQSIVTLCELAPIWEGAVSLVDKVCRWVLGNMRSENGYFYYQKTRFFENRIPYMRWSQAWMLYALAVYLNSGATKHTYSTGPNQLWFHPNESGSSSRENGAVVAERRSG